MQAKMVNERHGGFFCSGALLFIIEIRVSHLPSKLLFEITHGAREEKL